MKMTKYIKKFCATPTKEKSFNPGKNRYFPNKICYKKKSPSPQNNLNQPIIKKGVER